MLYRLSQGQAFEGASASWVPTLSINVIQTFLDDSVLPALQTVEQAYNKLMSNT